MERIDSFIGENKNTLVVKHHNENYEGKLPIWVITEFFSIGMLSRFYKDLKTEDKKVIAQNFYKTGVPQLESWLRCLTDLRNKCAHYSRMYYWRFTAKPKMPKGFDYIADNSLFTQLLTLKFLYTDSEKWRAKFVIPLTALIDEYNKSIELKHMGFPTDWSTRLL